MYRIIRLLVLFSLLFSYPAGSMAQDECGANQVYAARADYNIGKFVECINELKPCIEKNGFKKDNKTQAYALCAMCYLAMDSESKADYYIQNLITMNDNYTGDASDPERLKLRIDYIKLQLRDQLTSSVSKKAEKIELAPATVQIITAEDIENRGYMSLEQVFYDLPGFDISTNFGISYSVMYQRGFRTPALTENTLILIDGVQDNDIFSNGAFITMQYPLSNVKRIEVIYGPASSLYGSNAFCGVINVVTKDATDMFANNGDASNNNRISNSNEKPQNVAVNLQTGVASYNTRYVDGTVCAKTKNVTFSVTGRVYESDGTNLTSDNRWDGIPDVTNAAYTSVLEMQNTTENAQYFLNKYPQYFQLNAKGDSIVPTTAAINRADSVDKAGYTSKKYPNVSQFSNPINDFYVSAKLTVSNFKFGFQYWNKDEGAAGDFVDINASINSAYTNWQVRQYFAYAQYDQKLSERLSLSSLTYYEYSDLGNNTRVLHYSGYADKSFNDTNLVLNNKFPSFSPVYYSAQSNQFRTELKLPYIIDDHFDILAGSSLTTGIDQGNYLQSNVEPGIQNATVSSEPGGNDFAEYTISGYLTGSYHNTRLKLNIDAGGRLDNNAYRNVDGYGTVFNPRYDVVYYPGNFIFKAIYSTAFMDASPLNKYSTSATRGVANPTLEPERVSNYEISARYKFRRDKKDYVELAAYRAYYTNSIGYVSVLNPANDQYTNEYEQTGESLVYGIQAASEIFIARNISIYSNLTYTDPTSTYNSLITGRDSLTVPTGDIAAVSANAGVNISFLKKKLNLNTRVNLVGNKPTGATTSISSNPISDVPGYQLLNATLGYRFKRNYLIQFGCNNILNTSYYSPGVRDANDINYPSSVPQPLRNYYLKATISLKK